MNSKELKRLRRAQRKHVKTLPKELTEIPRDQFPPGKPGNMPIRAFLSQKFLVQLYDASHQFQSMIRMSVSRSGIDESGKWADKITWDELNSIKQEIGFGSWYGMELYPRDQDIVNVANIRHLWLLPVPLNIGWFSSQPVTLNPKEK